MKQANRDQSPLYLGIIVALGAVIFGVNRLRRTTLKSDLPPQQPNPDLRRNATLVFHAVYRNPQTNIWEVSPKISNLYGLGKLQTVAWRIIGDPDYFFPDNGFELDAPDRDKQFSAPVHALDDKRTYLLNVANDVDGKYSFTLRVQKPGGQPEPVDPVIHTGPGPH